MLLKLKDLAAPSSPRGTFRKICSASRRAAAASRLQLRGPTATTLAGYQRYPASRTAGSQEPAAVSAKVRCRLPSQMALAAQITDRTTATAATPVPPNDAAPIRAFDQAPS